MIRHRLPMGLPDKRSAITVVIQIACDRGVALGQRIPIAIHAVARHVLARHDAGTSRHASNILVVGAVVSNAFVRQAVDYRRSCHLAAIATQPIVTLFIGGYEENLPVQAIRPMRSARCIRMQLGTGCDNLSTTGAQGHRAQTPLWDAVVPRPIPYVRPVRCGIDCLQDL